MLHLHLLLCHINLTVLLQAIFVPIQGALNAVVYGWTRGDFLNVMSSQRVGTRTGSFSLSYDAMEGEGERVEDDGESEGTHHMRNSALSTSQEVEPVMDGGCHAAMTPVLPGYLLGEGEDRN